MADQFQYVKLPDGTYGKFRADADSSTIRTALQKDFPDQFRSQASPIPSPGLQRPEPEMSQVDMGGDPVSAPQPMFGSPSLGKLKRNVGVMGQMGKDFLTQPAGIPNIATQVYKASIGQPNTVHDLPTAAAETMTSAMGGEAILGDMGGGVPSSTNESVAAKVAAPHPEPIPVRAPSGSLPVARGGAGGGATSVADEITDVLRPGHRIRMNAAQKLIKRVVGGGTTEAPPAPVGEAPPPHSMAGKQFPTDDYGNPVQPEDWGKPIKERPAAPRSEPAWKSAPQGGTEVPSTMDRQSTSAGPGRQDFPDAAAKLQKSRPPQPTSEGTPVPSALDREPTSSGPGRQDYRPAIRKGLTPQQRALAKRPPAPSNPLASLADDVAGSAANSVKKVAKDEDTPKTTAASKLKRK